MTTDTPQNTDIVVVGAGIAGASVAAELAATHRVVMLEMEAQPGYHTTGRSAALFSLTYGPPVIRALSRASAPFLHEPQPSFSATPLLKQRDVLTVGRADQRASIDAAFDELAGRGGMRRISSQEARERMPLLRSQSVDSVLLDPDAADIDVHALHHGYLRRFKASGGKIETASEVTAIERDGAAWLVVTRKATFRAPILINASGAWADGIAALAGVSRIGLTPKQRTALMIAAPDGNAPDHWPMVVDADEDFYLKPDAGRFLISPADETPSPPCDAQPDEMDVAICVERIETAFDIAVTRIENKWAGLRSFVADKTPVVGFDSSAGGFFWLAGQGGYGIQTAPAMARTAAALAIGAEIPADIADQGVTAAGLSPTRLTTKPA
ncbi:FAD-dependent oxidoreductase [Mesorhizobium sp. CAU 1732]|uniref:NAD(P)/FAD-dependent oxidoreductase n=1 Tax=Mesorhizobium sp. CAU 1732 TaxID=3140358 RepID=UPI00325FEC2F